MQIFARITKVDEATGKVYGRAVQEVVDRSGEIFDYETSKPLFAKWSEAAASATDGKSVGNLRAMHGKVLFDSGKREEGLAELRAALEDLAPAREAAPNQYWDPFALLTSAACAARASDCASLKETCMKAQQLPLAATTAARLRAALSPE